MADPEFLLPGDALWIDFITTAATPPTLADLLPDAAAFHRWTKAVKLAAPTGSADFDTARLLRARLLDLATALEAHRPPPPSAIAIINGFLADLAGREQLVRIGGSWRIRFTPGRPPTALEAIAGSAAQTLAQAVVLIRRCPSPDCGLFMLDEGPRPEPGCRRGCAPRVERRRRTPITPLVADE
jgi:predicted RNA-binding Zn ribbon-like protein